jgi:hypothetical protein
MCATTDRRGRQTAPAVWFAYSEDRKGEHPCQHLKNFLFAGPDCGGEPAAAIYTLLGTAKLNGVDPAEPYLRTVLAEIADHPISRINELLPWHLAASLQTDSSQAA